MKFNLVVRAMMIAAVAAVALSTAVEAQAGLFNRGNSCCEPVNCCDEGGFLSRLRDRGGDDCCCEADPCCAPEPTCCEPEPCCAPEPTCCEAPAPACNECEAVVEPTCNECEAVVEPTCNECEAAVEPACGCEAEATCGCEAEPTCGCEADACCAPEPCCDADPCCDDKGGFLQRLRDRRSKSDCCASSCGC